MTYGAKKKAQILMAAAGATITLGADAMGAYTSVTTFLATTGSAPAFSWSEPTNWGSGVVPTNSDLAFFNSAQITPTMNGDTAYAILWHGIAGSNGTISSSGSTNANVLALVSSDAVSDGISQAMAVDVPLAAGGTLTLTARVQLGDATHLNGMAYVSNTKSDAFLSIAGSVTQVAGGNWGMTVTGTNRVELRGSTNSGNYMLNRWDYTGQTVIAAGAHGRLYNNMLPYGVGLPNMQINGQFRQSLNGGGLLMNAIDSADATALISRQAGANLGIGANNNDGLFTGSFNATNTRIFKIGNGVQTFSNVSNAYSRITVMNGVLSIDGVENTGVVSSGGNSEAAATGLTFDGGTLRYTGTGHSSNRLMTIGIRGGTLDASGSGALSLTATTGHVSSDTAQAFGDGNATTAVTQTSANMYGISGLGALVTAGQLTVAADTGTTIPAGTLPVSIDEGTRVMTLPAGATVNVPGSGFGAPLFTFTANTALARTFTLTGNNANDNTLAGGLTNSGLGGVLSVVKNGPGKWVMSGTNAYTGNTTVNGGTLQFNGAAAWAPALTGPGTTDITGSHVVFDYNDGSPDPAATVKGILTAGYAVNFASGQIHSSTATGDIGLGWVDDTTGLQVKVARTYYGDADLNLVVDSVDFNLLAASFSQPGEWGNADFDYSGTVDSVDFNLLAANFSKSLLGDASSGSLGALVPEPTSLTLVGLAATGLLAHRRRTN